MNQPNATQIDKLQELADFMGQMQDRLRAHMSRFDIRKAHTLYTVSFNDRDYLSTDITAIVGFSSMIGEQGNIETIGNSYCEMPLQII